FHLEEGERAVQSGGARRQEADPFVEGGHADPMDQEEIDESQEPLEQVDGGQRVADALEQDRQQVRIERREVERLAADPLPPRDGGRPRVVYPRIEDQTGEEDAVLGVEVEVDRREQGGGQEQDGQGPGNRPRGSQRRVRGLAFSGLAIYCL